MTRSRAPPPAGFLPRGAGPRRAPPRRRLSLSPTALPAPRGAELCKCMAGAGALGRTPGVAGPAESEDTCGWRCPEHSDRVAELFCRRCRQCVCALCPVLGAHRDHPVGLALEEAAHVKVGTLGREGPGGASPGSTASSGWDLATRQPRGHRAAHLVIVQKEKLMPQSGHRGAKANS